jgi:uncharacterized LabA/DUF88 family protein
MDEFNNKPSTPNPFEKVVIFIDRTNLDYAFRNSIKATELRVDFIELARQLSAGRFLRQVRFYFSDFLTENNVPEGDRADWVKRVGFYTFLRYNGFFLHQVGLRDYDGKKTEKGLDAALIRDIATICRNGCCDTIVLVAGDADYCEIITDAQRDYAIKVEIAFFEGQTSKELISRANRFVDLARMDISRDPRKKG